MADNRRRRIKVYNRMFMDAEYSFSMLNFYHGEMTSLLRGRVDDFHKFNLQSGVTIFRLIWL